MKGEGLRPDMLNPPRAIFSGLGEGEGDLLPELSPKANCSRGKLFTCSKLVSYTRLLRQTQNVKDPTSESQENVQRARQIRDVDVKGNSVDVKGNRVDVKGSGVDVKGNRVDVKGNRVDVKTCMVKRKRKHAGEVRQLLSAA
eukprot:1922990-Pyramimonas_sp.AAC.1